MYCFESKELARKWIDERLKLYEDDPSYFSWMYTITEIDLIKVT